MFHQNAVCLDLTKCFRFRQIHLRRLKRSGRHRHGRLELEPLENRLTPAALTQFVDPDPSPFDGFGTAVSALGNGNVVITAPEDSAGGTSAGAVYLFNGGTGQLISTLTGSHPYDLVGSGGITALSGPNFDYVIKSPNWNNGEGAVTFGIGACGVTGTLTATDSLIGETPGDNVGSGGVSALTNGNYVVVSPNWNTATAHNVGAVTFIPGIPTTGTVSEANSLVGTISGSFVGSGGIVTLPGSSNFIVDSANWGTALTINVGAVTWEPGNTGITGPVSVSNSLVGNSSGCFVGSGGVTALKTGGGAGNYVIDSPNWTNGDTLNAGAVTWGNGATGTTGLVTNANSLVGNIAGSLVGSGGVVALPNGNYVVVSPVWTDGSIAEAGAVTWGNGTAGIIGQVSAANSLVGSSAYNLVGAGGVVALPTTQNYVVDSPEWGNGTLPNLGAVTLGIGNGGTAGPVSASNSLVGTTANTLVGAGGVVALTNGNYVVKSPYWGTGSAMDVGAVTWENGTAKVSDVVSAVNSLVGTTTGSYVGSGGVVALPNGNYVVDSPDWNNGAAINAGAVTWEGGGAIATGSVSTANSLVGTTASSFVGSGGVTALANGNYVVDSPAWNNGTAINAGAVTWEFGGSPAVGSVSPANSLVGTTAGSLVGSGGVVALSGSSNPALFNYVVDSPVWNAGSAVAAGAVTFAGSNGITGYVTANNSAIGLQGTVSPKITISQDKVHDTFIVSFVNGADQVLVGSQASGFAPQVTGISPAGGPLAGGTTVIISGIALANATTVDFGSIPATIVSDSANQIVVASPAGSAGSVDVTVSIGGSISGSSASDQFTYVVPSISGTVGTDISTIAGKSFTGLVGYFSDSDPSSQASSYSVAITWGDGSTSMGQVFAKGAGSFAVYGSNTYAKAGLYTVTVQIRDSYGSSATASSKATVTLGAGIVGEVNGQWWTGLSSGSAFSTSLWATLDPNIKWVDLKTGDFNGDGQTDIITRDSQTGDWWVGLSNGSSFVTTVWTTWNPNVTWVDLQIGDFTGDGKDDIAARVVQTGQWWVGMSTGSSFVNSLWTTWNPNVTWEDVNVGDFTGGGKADVAGRVHESGQWWVAQSTGSSFTNSLWATWSPNVTWVDVRVGDFNGDGKADIVGRVLQSGQWWVAQSTGSSFTNSLWATWSPNVTWIDVRVGDFNGDGKADIVGRVLQNGQWWVGASNGSTGFDTSLWATWSPAVSWADVQVSDLNGDGLADITGRDAQTGSWWTAISNGSGFNTTFWGTWSSSVSWIGVNEGTFA